MRIIAILAYFLIFLKGSMIFLPFGMLLLFGLFEAEPIIRLFIGFADIALIALLVISFKKKSKTTLIIESVSYLLLLLPLAKIFISFPFEDFNYFWFLFPASCFILLFPLSIVQSYREIRKVSSISGDPLSETKLN